MSKLIASISLTIIFFLSLSVLIYAWLIPTYFPTFKTYLFIVIGIIGTTVVSGYYYYLYFQDESFRFRLAITIFYAVLIGLIFSALLVFILANIIGS